MAHEKTFYLKSGKTISNVKEFVKELKDMSSDVYKHHVNKEKNDFATWMRNSLNKEELAKKIDGQISKIQMELEVLRHLLTEEKSASTPAKKSTSTKKTASAKKTK